MLRNQVCGELIDCVGKMMVSPKSKAPVAATAAPTAAAAVLARRGRRDSKRGKRESPSQGRSQEKGSSRGRSHGGDRSRDRSQGRSRKSRRLSSRSTRSANEYIASYSEEQADEKPTYVGKFWSGSQLHRHWTSYSNLPASVLQEALFILDPIRLATLVQLLT